MYIKQTFFSCMSTAKKKPKIGEILHSCVFFIPYKNMKMDDCDVKIYLHKESSSIMFPLNFICVNIGNYVFLKFG